MAQTDTVFTGSIPELYDTFMVPMLFEPYAADLADRVCAARPMRLLETAAGSGVLSRALAPRLHPDARYVVTDLNQPMLDRAIARQPADTRLSWQQADALALPFADATFDAVACQFGAMFFPDKTVGYREAHRVLTDGGRFLFNVWDRIDDNSFAQCVEQTARRFFHADPPTFFSRIPHGYCDPDEIRRDLRAAGFDTVDIATLTYDCHAATARAPAIAMCQGTPFRNEILSRDPTALEPLTDAAASDLAVRFGADNLVGKMQALVITATR